MSNTVNTAAHFYQISHHSQQNILMMEHMCSGPNYIHPLINHYALLCECGRHYLYNAFMQHLVFSSGQTNLVSRMGSNKYAVIGIIHGNKSVYATKKKKKKKITIWPSSLVLKCVTVCIHV